MIRNKLRTFINRRVVLILLACVAILLPGVYLAVLQANDNFHAVIPDEVYRSAQLEKGELASYSWKYGIKSVLNLRGENLDKDWYRNEVKEAAFSNVKYINFKISAKRELTKEQALELVKIMQEAPKPLLIHCQGGADRTGLASALYMASLTDEPEYSADLQLSFIYGHFPSFGNDEMCETLELMKPIID